MCGTSGIQSTESTRFSGIHRIHKLVFSNEWIEWNPQVPQVSVEWVESTESTESIPSKKTCFRDFHEKSVHSFLSFFNFQGHKIIQIQVLGKARSSAFLPFSLKVLHFSKFKIKKTKQNEQNFNLALFFVNIFSAFRGVHPF